MNTAHNGQARSDPTAPDVRRGRANDAPALAAHSLQTQTPSPTWVAAALRALTFPDPAAKREAMATLEYAWPPVELLADLVVSHPDPRVRTGAAIRLGWQGHDSRPAAVHALRAAAYDPNRFVVLRALRALKHLRVPEALGDYVAALADADFNIVTTALEAIAGLGTPTLGAHLLPLLRHEDKRLHLAALVGIQQLNWPGAAPALIPFLDSHCGKPRVDQIDFNVPELCIRLLGGWRVKEAGPTLVRIVKGELGLRKKALDALQRLRCPEAAAALVPALAQAYADAHAEDLALKMLELMALTDRRESLPEVRRYLSHPSRAHRIKALEIVGAWKDGESAEAVRKLCRHDVSDFVRPEAARALARILGTAAVPELVRMGDELNPEMHRAVRESLEGLRALPQAGSEATRRLSEGPPAITAEGVAS